MSEEQIPDYVSEPLTKWANEPTIADLKQNIDDAAIDQEKHNANVARWLTNRANVRKKVEGQSNVAPKLIRKQAEWRYSSLSDPFLSTPDLFNVRPTTAGDRKRAIQNQLVLNKQFNTQLNKISFIDDYVREAVDIGTVITKLGWASQEEEVTESVPTYEYLPDRTGQLAQQYMALIQLQQENPEGYADHSTPGIDHALEIFMQTNGDAYHARQVGTKQVTKIVETKNQPTVEIPDSDNIIIDPSCGGDLDKASFIGEKFKASVSSLKKDGIYKNLDKVNVESQSALANPDFEEGEDVNAFTFKDKPRKQFVVFTYWGDWDINGDGTTRQIVASWVGDVLIRMDLNPFPDQRPPFVKAVYMPVRGSVFGEPDGELLIDNQEIIGAVTRGAIDILGKSSNAQTGTRKDFLDVTNRRRFQKGEDYEFNGTVDPRLGVFMHTYPEIPQSAFNMLTMQNQDAESLTGVKAYASGISGKGLGDVATGVRGALDAASKRELGILRRLAQGVVDIGRKIIAMNAEFLSDEEVVRITDKEFVQVRRDDLAGNFDLQLSISTAEEDNKKAEELAYMLQTMGPNQDPAITRMIQSDMARLRKMPDLAKKIEEYQPEPDPMEVKKAELEIVLLEAQIEKERALALKHQTEAEANGARSNKDNAQADLNRSKAGAESAKARDTHSAADQKDLDYLDNRTGAAHQKEIDKINKKSQNDAGLKMLDNLVKQSQPETTQA